MSGQVQVRNDDLVTLLRSEFPRSPWGCAFLAYNSVTDVDVTGNGTLVTVDFDTEVFDLGNDFAADIFTAPATGTYQFNAAVMLQNLAAAHTSGNIEIVTSNRRYTFVYANLFPIESSADLVQLVGSTLADMDATDTAYVRVNVSNGAKVVDIFGAAPAVLYTYFSGHRVS